MTRGGVVCLVGPDGVGKTTQARLLADSLRERGLRVKLVWLRFSHFLSLPVLALGKLTGLSEQVTYENGSRVGYHDFQKSAFVSIAYEIARIVDFWLAYLVRVKLRARLGWFVICDRFYPDVVADVRLSTGGPGRVAISIWRKLQKTTPRPSAVFLLQAPLETLRGRRPDLASDRTLSSKILIYEELRESLDLSAFDAKRSSEQLQTTLEEELLAISEFQRPGSGLRGGPGTGIRTRLNQLHLNFVKGSHPPSSTKTALILSSSWLFQGMLYADRTEVAFKLVLELALFIALLAVTSLFFPLLFAVALAWPSAHTLMWIFTGQPMVALKGTAGVRKRASELREYLVHLDGRIRATSSFRFAAFYGSASRGHLNERSDLDVKLVRRRGVRQGLAAMGFLMAERVRSTFHRFPLDIYVLDGFTRLGQMEPEPGLTLLERQETA